MTQQISSPISPGPTILHKFAACQLQRTALSPSAQIACMAKDQKDGSFKLSNREPKVSAAARSGHGVGRAQLRGLDVRLARARAAAAMVTNLNRDRRWRPSRP